VNRVLVSLTTRQLLGRRRTVLLALALALPIVVALVYRLGDDPDPTVTPTEYALGLVGGLIGNVLLPIVALVLGTGAMGGEIDDGTAVFLLTKPVPRWRIATVKIGVAAASTIVLVVPATVATAWIVRGSPTAEGLAPGVGLAAGIAALLYCAVFVALSAVTSRALVVGLVYVFVWEATVTNLLAGLRWISIREYATGWADLVLSTSDPGAFDPRLNAGSAVVATIGVLAAAVAAATAALDRFQVAERG
jgi:ABC-2 type transport system permease protein